MPLKESLDRKARENIASWLRYKMRVRRLNIRATADLMDVSPAAVSRVYDEKRTPGLDWTIKFSKTFDVPLEVLIYEPAPSKVTDGTEQPGGSPKSGR